MGLKELIKQGYVFPALLPEKNDFLLNEEGRQLKGRAEDLLGRGSRFLELSRLDDLAGYTVPLIAHDYGAKTPVMWNTLYGKLGLNIRNIMVVGNPENAEIIFKYLKEDPKYLGGGAGVGFKEKLGFLDEVCPEDLKAINIIVNERGRLIGYNTDASGFVKSLEGKLAGVGKRVQGGKFILVGAGGVAKEVARYLADKNADYIAIINRTFSKAVAIANELNVLAGRDLAVAAGENMTRGFLLNSEIKPDAVINLSDKGTDKFPDATFFYSTTDNSGRDLSPEIIEHISRDTIRLSVTLNPEMIYADIVLPSFGRSKSLRLIEGELRQALERTGKDANKYILDGIPMVVYQAAPAYVKVQDAHMVIHEKKVSEDEALEVFKKAASLV